MLGILFGLIAALLQSTSYLCLRLFFKRHNNDVVKVLVLSHIIMGIISIPLAIHLMPETMPKVSDYIYSLLGTAGFYLLGQLFLFAAIVRSEPSRVSPFLGMKIFILAVISVVFFQQSFGLAKWLAVILSTSSIFLLYNSGKKLDLKCLCLIVLACFSYCLSDLGIKALVDDFRFLGLLRGACLSTALCYSLCGVFGVLVLFFVPGKLTRDTWLYSLPFAFSWLIAMIFMFSCIGLVGVVFANILQSTRGIMSVALGFLIAHAGFVALEPKITKKILMQRILAAILMTISIAMFLL